MASGITWWKSSYSTQDGGSCVEVAWFKSSYSEQEAGNCIEVCRLKSSQHAEKFEDLRHSCTPTPHIGIRDSKSPSLRPLTIPAPAWTAFVAELRNN
ncbi:DUF397 domain-containing protein [Streptomyces sp. NPDC001262]|uniref:DUF397 domain-containing protein n=1 Tax=unclassified Streptomyces TaxID=2593676 RepID=UPI00369794BA